METYFLQPDQEATLSLYNGTFESSENVITRDRISDASVVAQGKRKGIDPTKWKDQDSTVTQFTFTTGEPATYVAGVSTKARNIELTAEKFNSYLKSDGVLDMLEQRTKDDLLAQDAIESYQKHVKAIYQVGDVKTNDWSTVLGYPIEFVPQANPYEKYSGETLEVLLLLDGKPLSNQLVFADYINSTHAHSHNEGDDGHSHEPQTEEAHTHGVDDGHSHEHDEKANVHDNSHDDGQHSHSEGSHDDAGHSHTSGQKLRTDNQGLVSVDLPEDGIYYLRTIHMTRATDSDELTHRSKWATLTFEVSHAHNESTHTHEHDDEDGIPTWVFILGSVLIVGVLFFVFRKSSM